MNPPVRCGRAIWAWFVVSCLLWGVLFVTSSLNAGLYVNFSNLSQNQSRSRLWDSRGNLLEEATSEALSVGRTRKGVGLSSLRSNALNNHHVCSVSLIGFFIVLAAAFLIIQCARKLRLRREVWGAGRSVAGAEGMDSQGACGGFNPGGNAEEFVHGHGANLEEVEKALAEVYREISDFTNVCMKVLRLLHSEAQLRYASKLGRFFLRELSALFVFLNQRLEPWMIEDVRRFHNLIDTVTHKYPPWKNSKRISRLRHLLQGLTILLESQPQRLSLSDAEWKEQLLRFTQQQVLAFSDIRATVETLASSSVLLPKEVSSVYECVRDLVDARHKKLYDERLVVFFFLNDPAARYRGFEPHSLTQAAIIHMSAAEERDQALKAAVPQARREHIQQPRAGPQAQSEQHHRDIDRHGAVQILESSISHGLITGRPTSPRAALLLVEEPHSYSTSASTSSATALRSSDTLRHMLFEPQMAQYAHTGHPVLRLHSSEESSGYSLFGPKDERFPFLWRKAPVDRSLGASQQSTSGARGPTQHLDGGLVGRRSLPAEIAPQLPQPSSDDSEQGGLYSLFGPHNQDLFAHARQWLQGTRQQRDYGGQLRTPAYVGGLRGHEPSSGSGGLQTLQPTSEVLVVEPSGYSPLGLRVAPVHLPRGTPEQRDPRGHLPTHPFVGGLTGYALSSGFGGPHPPQPPLGISTPQSSAEPEHSVALGALRRNNPFAGFAEGMPAEELSSSSLNTQSSLRFKSP